MFEALGLVAVCAGLGGPVQAGEAPADREVLRALPQAKGVPYVLETTRDDVVIVKNKLASRTVDVPLIGEVTVVHWECPVYYTETVESSYPFPCKVRKKRVAVVYVDKVDGGK
jgi:hypothetical protein